MLSICFLLKQLYISMPFGPISSFSLRVSLRVWKCTFSKGLRLGSSLYQPLLGLKKGMDEPQGRDPDIVDHIPKLKLSSSTSGQSFTFKLRKKQNWKKVYLDCNPSALKAEKRMIKYLKADCPSSPVYIRSSLLKSISLCTALIVPVQILHLQSRLFLLLSVVEGVDNDNLRIIIKTRTDIFNVSPIDPLTVTSSRPSNVGCKPPPHTHTHPSTVFHFPRDFAVTFHLVPKIQFFTLISVFFRAHFWRGCQISMLVPHLK